MEKVLKYGPELLIRCLSALLRIKIHQKRIKIISVRHEMDSKTRGRISDKIPESNVVRCLPITGDRVKFTAPSSMLKNGVCRRKWNLEMFSRSFSRFSNILRWMNRSLVRQ